MPSVTQLKEELEILFQTVLLKLNAGPAACCKKSHTRETGADEKKKCIEVLVI